MLWDGAGATFFYVDIASTDAGPGPNRAYNSEHCQSTAFTATGRVFWLQLADVRPSALELHTCAEGANGFDTDLSIFTGSCSALTQVACDGDGQGLSGCAHNYYSRITGLQLTEDEQYWVVVGGFNGGTGAVRLAAEYQTPSPPSIPAPPVLPPLPPPSPQPGGFVVAASENELRSMITEAAADVSIYLLPSADFKLSSKISCSGNIKVTVASSGEGATLDGQEMTGLFYLSGRCSLTLRGLTLVNGWAADDGGVVWASYAGDIEIIDSTIRDCSASEVRRVELAALQQCCTAVGREMERATAASPHSLLATAGGRRRLREGQRCGLDNRLDRDELLCWQCAPRRASSTAAVLHGSRARDREGHGCLTPLSPRNRSTAASSGRWAAVRSR